MPLGMKIGLSILLGQVGAIALSILAGVQVDIAFVGVTISASVITVLVAYLWLLRVREHTLDQRNQQPENLVRDEDDDAALTVILSALPTPMITFNAARKILWANSAAQNAFPHLLVGDHLLDLLPEPKLPETLAALFRHQQPVHCAELRVDRPELRYYSAHGVLLTDHAQARRGLLMLIDQTEVRWAAERGVNFVADVGHELRTPLTSIVGFLETLSHHQLGEKERAEALSIMQQQTGRMVHLTEDLLQLSALDQPNRHALDQLVDFRKLVTDEVCVTQNMQKENASRIQLELHDGEHWLVGDELRLAQIVRNLLDNALKYSKKSSTVTVRLETVPRADVPEFTGAEESNVLIALSVIDQGEGIAAHHLPRLTERFYRVDRARSGKAGGTGLGLAIVKHIVQNHQGCLRSQSQLGKGSCFQVFLPSLGQAAEENAEKS